MKTLFKPVFVGNGRLETLL